MQITLDSSPLPSSGLDTQVTAQHPGPRSRWVLLGHGDAGPEKFGELSLKDLSAVTSKDRAILAHQVLFLDNKM